MEKNLSPETLGEIILQLDELAHAATCTQSPSQILQWLILKNLFFSQGKSRERRLFDYARAACLGSLKIFDRGSTYELADPWDFFLMYCAESNITETDAQFGVNGLIFYNTYRYSKYVFLRTGLLTQNNSE